MDNNALVVFTGQITEFLPAITEEVPVTAEEMLKLSQEEIDLLDKTRAIGKEVEHITAEIRQMDHDLQVQSAEMVRELLGLQQEEARLIDACAELDEEEPEEDERDWVFDEDGNRLDEDGNIITNEDDDDPLADLEEQLAAHNENINKKNRKARREKSQYKNDYEHAKALFRQIARLTHPDKTKVPFMHELFRAARLAREAQDIQSLELILKQAQASKADLFNMLVLRVERLRLELQESEQARFQLMTSDPFRMLKDWRYPENRNNVTAHFRATLNRNIQGVAERIARLQNKLNPGKSFFSSRTL